MTSKRTSSSLTTDATPDGVPAESCNSRSLAEVVDSGDYRALLEAMLARLAAEADEVTWDKHKRECICVCGMGDGRTLVAVLKQLDVVARELEALPNPERRSRVVELADRRARRLADAANQ